MQRMPPTPVAKSFVVCKQIFIDRYTDEVVIVAPTHAIVSASFPVVAALSVYSCWMSAHGSYELMIQLQDLEGNVMWGQRQERPLVSEDPLRVTYIRLQDIPVFFPRPGKYELVMLANSQEVSRDVFFARLPSPPAMDSPSDAD